MFIIGNFLIAIATILDIALSIYMWVIIARALLSWVIPFSRSPLVFAIAHGISRFTDPFLRRIQRVLPLRGMGMDLTPLIAILIIVFLKYFLVATLLDIGRRI
jgi:YggT family protein